MGNAEEGGKRGQGLTEAVPATRNRADFRERGKVSSSILETISLSKFYMYGQ